MELYQPAIAKYQKALELDPSLAAARERLFKAYVVFALWDPERMEYWAHRAEAVLIGFPEPPAPSLPLASRDE
jgi:hypothetical protein